MPQSLVVAITLGKRDLQVLIHEGGALRRVSVKNVGACHTDLLRQPDALRLWLPQDGRRINEWKSTEAVWQGWESSPLLTLTSRDRGRPVESNHPKATDSEMATEPPRIVNHLDLGEPDGAPRLWLMPGILAESLTKLRREIREGAVTVKKILLLHTDRDASSRWASDEPRAAAPLLKAFLSTWLPQVTQEQIEIVRYLIGTEDKDVENSEGDFFLRPAAAQRIDDALKSAASSGCRVRLHDSGGIPSASDVLRYSARFRFGADSVEYLPPDESKERLEKIPGRVTMPVELLDARRRAVELVRTGRFIAAAELSTPFKTIATDTSGEWQRHLDAVGSYFRGYRRRADSLAERLDQHSTTEACLRAIIDHPARCLHVAMIAEAALAAEEVLTGATQTVTFLDVALFDAADRALRRDSTTPCIDWRRSEITPETCRLNADELIQAMNAVLENYHWLIPPYQDQIDRWANRPTRVGERWQKAGLAWAVSVIPNYEPLGRAILDLWDSIYRPRRPGGHSAADRESPASLRNRIEHSLIDDEDWNSVKQLFGDRQLWRRDDDGQRHFLLKTKIEPVLAALDVPNAAGLFNDLTDSLIRDIENCPLYDRNAGLASS